MKCCERDSDGDGNCDIHLAPGVLRQSAGGPRKEVLAFAQIMEQKLRERDYKGGWKSCGDRFLLAKLDEEVGELKEAIRVGSSKEIAREAADVSNIAMMLADIRGGLL